MALLSASTVPSFGAQPVWLQVDGQQLKFNEGQGGTHRWVRSDAPEIQQIWFRGRRTLDGKKREQLKLGPSEGSQIVIATFPMRYDEEQGALIASFAKALHVAENPNLGDPIRWSETGQMLEIVPQSDPVALARSGGRLEVQALFDREPLADVWIEAWPASGGEPTRLRTDEIGVVAFRPTEPGLWVLSVEHAYRCEACGGDRVLGSSTLSLRIGAN